MDTIDDVDIFADSPENMTVEEASESRDRTERAGASERNPVKEHLLKQLSEVEERVDRTKRQIEETASLKAKILQKFSTRAFYGESSSSSSESDLITSTGEPVVKRRRKTKRSKQQPLVVKSTWQHVTDDKWIVGVMLENTCDRDLEELDLHVTIKDVDEFSGISAFWTKDSKSFWRRTDEAKSGQSNQVAATVVLDLPKFTRNSTAELCGTVTYELDEKTLQTLIPVVNLNVTKIMGGEYDLSISRTDSEEVNRVQAIITVKSLSIEKITDFKYTTHSLNRPFTDVLTNMGFQQILPKVFTGHTAALDRCIVEVTSSSVSKNRCIIYARSISQLNMLLHIVQNALPLGTSVSCRNVTAEGVIQAFETELNMYLTAESTFELEKAIVKCDLMTQEFENGCTIYRGE